MADIAGNTHHDYKLDYISNVLNLPGQQKTVCFLSRFNQLFVADIQIMRVTFRGRFNANSDRSKMVSLSPNLDSIHVLSR